MQQYGNIFIKNIYYMLTYVFRNMGAVCDAQIKTEEFENIHELFAKILYLGISNQIKRGLYQEYEEFEENLSAIKGKINLTKSITTNTIPNSKIICEFDEYTENTFLNQILKSVCMTLIAIGDISAKSKKNLKHLMLFFSNVEMLNLKDIKWNQIAYHRNNSTYKMLLNICYLVVKGLLQTTESGSSKLSHFMDDECMHKIYEKFILEYYRKHHNELSANASFIKWDVEENSSGIEFLPSMQSDIMLTYSDRCLIIDAKFYSHTMQTKFDKKSFISANLYQIFTYIKNKEADKQYRNVAGLILYAKTNETITPDNEYFINNNKIAIKTLDLNSSWENITKNLETIVSQLRL